MAAKFLKSGRSVDYKPVANVTAGQLVKLGAFVGVADNDIPANKVGSLTVRGVYNVDGNLLANAVIGDEFDLNFGSQIFVANGSGDASVKVFAAVDKVAQAPTKFPLYLNFFGS